MHNNENIYKWKRKTQKENAPDAKLKRRVHDAGEEREQRGPGPILITMMIIVIIVIILI